MGDVKDGTTRRGLTRLTAGEVIGRAASAVVVAFVVSGGLVLGEFVRVVRPVTYLVRPFLFVLVCSAVVGLASLPFGRWSIPVAAFSAAWIVAPSSPVAIGLAVVLWVLVAYRLWRRTVVDISRPLIVAVAVFFGAGVVPVIPMLALSQPARAETLVDSPPQYAIMLDGYPRPDTLASAGVDITEFLDALDIRGFDLYPEATSTHHMTFETLSEMFGVDPQIGTISQQRATRDQWRLPDGWSAVVPPLGLVTIPHATTLNPGGTNAFELALIAKSLLAPFARDWVLDGLRAHLNRNLDTIASTEAPRVFAHVFAPHPPILYRNNQPTGAMSCWPNCRPEQKSAGLTISDLGLYIQWLNGRLIGVVDEILARRPDAEIVLFSDHGARLDPEPTEEWHRVFLAARTPDRPGLFADAPHPGMVLEKLTAPRIPPPSH